ncbi:MAG: hypothetical protein LBK41_05970 [Clostridiales bacterium]|jgi:hypothetical protein|nr:hypothetical protein [Clostridiales bacterium]
MDDINELVDIRDVVIDPSLSQSEKKASFAAQIKNPRRYRCGDIIVRASFANTSVTLQDRIVQILLSRYNASFEK